MRDGRKNEFANNMFVGLKDNNWLEKQRVAGKVAAGALLLLEAEVKNGTEASLLELNDLAETFIQDNKCTCTFKGYKGFPAGVCISVNKQLVHGIPDSYRLQEGDLVSFDLGTTYEGAIADTAITRIYGQPKSERHVRLVKATEEALMKGIEAIAVGKQLGCIGEAIYKHARAANFSVINNYGGHGLDWNTPHSSPFVENKSEANKGIRIQPGLAIAIEPMLLPGSPSTRTGEDGWTVYTPEVGCHFEHSVYVHQDHVEIITDRNGL